MQNHKGFTIIELIVVIVIVAVLVGIVLFTITSYFSKGKIAAIQSNMAGLISAGTVWLEQNGSYSGFCTSPTVFNVYNAIYKITKILTRPMCYCNATFGRCDSSATKWCACVNETTGTNPNSFCVDSSGFKKELIGVSCSSRCSPTLAVLGQCSQ